MYKKTCARINIIKWKKSFISSVHGEKKKGEEASSNLADREEEEGENTEELD